MGAQTGISWTDHTFNPWWGCERVSPGCQHCYAETLAKRFNVEWGKTADRRFFGDKHWNEPLRWDKAAARAGVRRRVFCASMADVFEDRDDLVDHRDRLFRLVRDCPNLDWLLLTKRPQNVQQMVPGEWDHHGWPSNVWLGFTAEDQAHYGERATALWSTLARRPAVVFVSAEPLLGPITDLTTAGLRPDWVIVGGESGPGARPMHPDWARSIRDECTANGIPFHFKQWGEFRPLPHRDMIGATHFVNMDGAHGPWSLVGQDGKPGATMVQKLGKHDAGRTLDDCVWDEYPT